MEKQEGARGTERWNRSEREREGATLLLYFCTTVPSDFIARSFPGLSSVLPFSFLGPSLVFPRSFPGLSSVLPFLFFFFPLYLFRYS